MMNTTWIKRTGVVLAVAGLTVAVTSPKAQAGTAGNTLTVQTTVSNSCTVAAATLSFGGYTAGQPGDATSSADIGINCTGTGTASLNFNPSGGSFSMSDGPVADQLGYKLCTGTPCTSSSANYFTPASSATIPVGLNGKYTVNGVIPGNQSPTITSGAFTQSVTMTLTF